MEHQLVVNEIRSCCFKEITLLASLCSLRCIRLHGYKLWQLMSVYEHLCGKVVPLPQGGAVEKSEKKAGVLHHHASYRWRMD